MSCLCFIVEDPWRGVTIFLEVNSGRTDEVFGSLLVNIYPHLTDGRHFWWFTKVKFTPTGGIINRLMTQTRKTLKEICEQLSTEIEIHY
jgi:hypothetical protein